MRLLIAGSLLILLNACGTDPVVSSNHEELTIRLRSEPDVLHPIISRRPSSETLERLIYRCPQEINPQTLQPEPILLSQPPRIDTVAGMQLYTLQFRKDAIWQDGTAITALDHAFTLKACMLPFIPNNRLYTFLDIIDSLDCPDPYTLQISVGSESMKTEIILTTLPTYPRHYCDPNGLLDNVSFDQLKELKVEDTTAFSQGLMEFAEVFSSTKYTRDSIIGAGPYTLDRWISNDQLQFTALNDHWTQSVPAFVQANTNRIIYRLLPDATLAMSGLKNGQLDILPYLTPEQFQQLETEFDSAKYDAHSSARYYFIALNNSDLILQDVMVRRALAHAMNVDACIDRLFFSYAQRIVGPINPAKDYYASQLKPVEFDLGEAKRLLETSGWLPGNNGIRQKALGGKTVPLELEITTAVEGLSRDVAIIFQEACKEIGVAITLKPQSTRQTMQQVRSQVYQMACLAASQVPDLDDPYNSWHSSQVNTGGRNYCVFSDSEADAAIVNIRTSVDKVNRDQWYKKFQEIIYREQPAIFLVTPMHLVAYNQELEIGMSLMAPGFFANTVE